MLKLKLNNTHGCGDVRSYVERTHVEDLDIEFGDFVVEKLTLLQEDSDDIIGLTTEGKALILKVESFTEEGLKLILEDKFDLFINDVTADNAFAVKGSKFYLYNKETRTSSLIRDFGNEQFTVKAPFVRKHGKHYILDTGNQTLVSVSVGCEDAEEIVNNNGVTVDTSVKKFFNPNDYIYLHYTNEHIGYVKSDGTCWIYNTRQNVKFKLDISESDLLLSNWSIFDYYTELADLKLAASRRFSIDKSKIKYFCDEDSNTESQNTLIMFLPKDGGILVTLLHEDKAVSLKTATGKPIVFKGVVGDSYNNKFVAIEACDDSSEEFFLNELIILDVFEDPSTLEELINSISRCTSIYFENGEYKTTNLDAEDFFNRINQEINDLKYGM